MIVHKIMLAQVFMHARIGLIFQLYLLSLKGISLGGMHTWLCACVDERVRVMAPMIGVQNFCWAVDNNQFSARVASIPEVDCSDVLSTESLLATLF